MIAVRQHLAIAVCVLLMTVLPIAAFAATVSKEKTLGIFGAWHAYSYNEGSQTVCYMMTTKIIKSTGLKKRTTPYLMITHRPTEASSDVFSYGAGTLINSKHGAKILVRATPFELFSVRDTAWARDALTDHKIAHAVTSASLAETTAYPTVKGAKKISDTFDLTGAPLAYSAIGKACGLIKEVPRKKTSKK